MSALRLWLLKSSSSEKTAPNEVMENVYPVRESRLQGTLVRRVFHEFSVDDFF